MTDVVSATHVSGIRLPRRSSDGLKLHIVGMAVVHDNFLVFASRIEMDDDYDECTAVNYDYKGSVKVIDINRNAFVSEIELNAKVQDVINVEEEQIAVAVCSREGTYNNVLLAVSKFGSLEKISEFELPKTLSFHGFTYSMGVLYIAAYTKILITDMQGNELKTFILKEQCMNRNGTSLYLCSDFEEINDDDDALSAFATHIAVGPDKETMYVTDVGNCTVRSFSMDGKFKSIAKNQECDCCDVYPGINGIEMDVTGTIFVNHILRGKVYILSKESNTFETLIEGKKGHFAILKTGNRLLIDMDGTVHIYEVCKRAPSKFQNLATNCLLL